MQLPGNARLETVVQFTPDPRGWGMFAALLRRGRTDLNDGSQVYIDARGGSYGGWAQTAQRFIGLAGRTGGQARAITPTSSQFVNERSTGNETAMAAFYEQLGRKQGMS